MLNKSDKTHINIYLPDELVLKLRAVSKELEITISKICADGIKLWLQDNYYKEE